MSLKASVGFSRKIGEPHFSSRGASVHLEVELDDAVLEHPAQLLEQIHDTFELARSAVDADHSDLARLNDQLLDGVDLSSGSGPYYERRATSTRRKRSLLEMSN